MLCIYIIFVYFIISITPANSQKVENVTFAIHHNKLTTTIIRVATVIQFVKCLHGNGKKTPQQMTVVQG